MKNEITKLSNNRLLDIFTNHDAIIVNKNNPYDITYVKSRNIIDSIEKEILNRMEKEQVKKQESITIVEFEAHYFIELLKIYLSEGYKIESSKVDGQSYKAILSK